MSDKAQQVAGSAGPDCSAVPFEGADDTWRGKLRDLSALWRLRPAYVCMDCGRTFAPPLAKWKKALHHCTPNTWEHRT
jgi:hypothetical protein